MDVIEDPIPISLVSHLLFCPRRAWLEAAGEKTDTMQMASGTSDHARVHDPSTARGAEMRAIDVGHPEWGIVGRIDAAEVTESGLVLREYKASPVRQEPSVTDPTRVQLALQAACLSRSGYEVAGAEVYFTTHNRRVPVELTSELYGAAESAVAETRRVINAQQAPPPLEDDPKCSRCSHIGVCLPEERKLGEVVRRVRVLDPDTQVVHLSTFGARAGISAGRIVVTKAGEKIGEVPIERVLALQVHGNVDVSSALLRELLWRGLTVVWCTGIGRVVGWASSASSPNGLTRVAQHVASAEGRLAIAREMLAAKVSNQATQARRSLGNVPQVAALRSLSARLLECATWQDALGVEGEAASVYFELFPRLLVKEAASWAWSGRSGRPARDPVNALLNYAYGMLLSDCIRAVVSCGLDPHAGFIHSSNRNKPALALDLMEEFRAPVADSVVINAINNGEVRPDDFDDRLGSVRLNDRARKALIAGYERRVQTEFRHPVFGYQVSWRRAMEVQARQVLGYLDGSQPRYVGVRVR